jgi:uncharacterized protein YaiL (DUF2058 family)
VIALPALPGTKMSAGTVRKRVTSGCDSGCFVLVAKRRRKTIEKYTTNRKQERERVEERVEERKRETLESGRSKRGAKNV